MDKAESLIGIYRTCFYICMVITILGLANAVFLFMKFDVRGIFEIRTGRAAKRTIQKIAEANAMTGRLRPVEMDFTTGGLSVGNTGAGATTPLKSSPTEPPIQRQPIEETPLSAPPAAGPPPQPAAAKPAFGFTVTQSVLLVHTDEQI